jgi:hypothetical protein
MKIRNVDEPLLDWNEELWLEKKEEKSELKEETQHS